MRVRHETEVPDTDKTFRQHVQEESSNELIGGNGHLFLFVAVSVITPEKPHVLAVKGNQSMVGNCNTMCVASEVTDYLFRATKCWLGINHPVLTK